MSKTFGPLVEAAPPLVTREPKLRLSAEGQRIVADFLARYDPPVKVYAKKHHAQYWALRYKGVTNEDINSLCVMGVMRAAWKFEPERGFQFTTYAVSWMWAMCTRELEERNKSQKLSTKEVRIDWNEDGYQAPLPDHRAVDPDAHLDRLDTEAAVARLMAVLSPRERAVIQARFGFGCSRGSTLQEVAATEGMVTKERIRQIQESAMEKMRRVLAGLPVVEPAHGRLGVRLLQYLRRSAEPVSTPKLAAVLASEKKYARAAVRVALSTLENRGQVRRERRGSTVYWKALTKGEPCTA